jgi:hypothetical protein
VVAGSAGGSAAEPQGFKEPAEHSRGRDRDRAAELAVSVAVATGEQRDFLWKKLVARPPFSPTISWKVEWKIPRVILMPKTERIANRAGVGAELRLPHAVAY